MKIKEVMSQEVVTIQAEATLKEAAQTMAQENIGALPVYQGDVLIGMLTDRDIVIKAAAKGLNLNITRVEQAMTWKAECCMEDREVEEAAQIMEAKRVRRLLVLDKDGLLAGIVSLGDIALRTHNKKLVEEVLETVAAVRWNESEDMDDSVDNTYGADFQDEGVSDQ